MTPVGPDVRPQRLHGVRSLPARAHRRAPRRSSAARYERAARRRRRRRHRPASPPRSRCADEAARGRVAAGADASSRRQPQLGGHVAVDVRGRLRDRGRAQRLPQPRAADAGPHRGAGTDVAADRGAVRRQASLHRARRRLRQVPDGPATLRHLAGAVVARQAAPARRAVRRRAAAPAKSRCTPSRRAGWGRKSPTCSSTPPSAASRRATAGGCRSRRSFPGWRRWSARTAASSERSSPSRPPARRPGPRSS